jgi:hypothetical protein
MHSPVSERARRIVEPSRAFVYRLHHGYDGVRIGLNEHLRAPTVDD